MYQKLIESRSNTKAIQGPARVCVEEHREQLRQEAADIRAAAQKAFKSRSESELLVDNAIWLRWKDSNADAFYPFLKNSSENRRCLSRRCFASTVTRMVPFLVSVRIPDHIHGFRHCVAVRLAFVV